MPKQVKIARLGIFPRVSRPVFLASAGVIVLFIVYGTAFTGSAEDFFADVQDLVAHYFGW